MSQKILHSCRCIIAITALLCLSSGANAHTIFDGNGQAQAEAFSRIYATFCMKHLSDLKKLADRMALSPQLPKEKAAQFLQGKPGSAWPVPEQSGTFILAIRSDKPMCMVYGMKADNEAVEKIFSSMAKAAPSPMVIKQVQNEQLNTRHGSAHSISYEWTMPKQPRKMLFSLTTTASDTAPLQAIASAALITK